MYHGELGFSYMLRAGSEFPDATVLDGNGLGEGACGQRMERKETWQLKVIRVW